MNTAPRPLGRSPVSVGPLGLGCWPLAGMTRAGVTHEAKASGRSERHSAGAAAPARRLPSAATPSRSPASAASTGRLIHPDGRPERIRAEVEESLMRLGTDHLDLLYLHAPDPTIPIEESAGELKLLLDAGKTRAVGLSNASVAELTRFHAVCPLSACQMHFNMLQREIEREVLPWCMGHGVGMVVYWPLMKVLLAAKMHRGQVFPTTDSRHKYPMFNGVEFDRNLDFVEALRPIAGRLGVAVPDLVLAWTAEQPGITSVLFGATSPEQVQENAQALACNLDAAAITARGPVAGRRAV